MKKFFILIVGILISTISISSVLAADIDGFLVKVEKNISVNEAVDLEISAVKDGNIVQDYEGTIFIKIEGLLGTQSTIPSNGVYLFNVGDQGKKLFSKGLKIMKSGTYTLVVESITDESINSKTTLIVKDSSVEKIKDIDIISPTKDGIEMGETVDVIGSAMELPNTTVKIHLNGEIVGSTRTDENGEFSSKINLTTTGENILEIKAFDLDNNLIGKSNRLSFKSDKDTKTPAIESINVEPGTTVEKASRVTLILKTREDISIAKVVFGEDSSYQMEKIAVGEFRKSFLAQKAGQIHIKFMIVEDGEEKIFDRNTVITVHEVGDAYSGSHQASTGSADLLTGVILNSIGEVLITPNSVDGASITITWKSIGDAKKFMVSYGTEKTTLEESIIVDTNSIGVEKLNPKATYYFQITPLNDREDKNGKSSDVIEYIIGEQETCTVGNITVKTEKINDKNYLTWTTVEGVEKYEIYRSETANSKTTISDMNKIGETMDTKFEYPFDMDAEEEKYAYYAIQAVCKGGQKVQIGNVEKVKTGPFDNILVILILSGLMFSMYKLYKVSA